MKTNGRRTWAEIHTDRLLNNIDVIRSCMAEKGSLSEIMAVVKADAYGHGEEIISKALCQNGIKNFAVSNFDEAKSVREHCPDSEILILGYTPPEYAQKLKELNIIQGIASYDHAVSLAGKLKDDNKPLRCHIKIDTGMGRVGLKFPSPDDCAKQIAEICGMEKLNIEGIYTHFAAADSPDEKDIEYTIAQKEYICSVYEKANKLLAPFHLRHIHYLNSAGACYLKENKSMSTLARIGIIMYGLMPNSEYPLPIDVKQVMELKSIVAHVKYINKGDCVSYGRTFTAEHEMKIATVPIGYADGYPRLLSSKADVLIKGKRCRIIGRICMDQLMADVSCIDDLEPGETVTLIGTDGNECITADELASIYGTIGYEIVCGISKRVPRIITID